MYLGVNCSGYYKIMQQVRTPVIAIGQGTAAGKSPEPASRRTFFAWYSIF